MTRASSLRDAALRLRSEEAGSTLPLIVGAAALAAALILVITAASSLYLERKRLFTVADGAALAGAEAWSFAASTAPGAPAVQFDDAALRRAVDEYLAAADARASFDGLRLVRVASDDGRGVVVALSATWRWPIGGGAVPVEVPLEVVATARSVIR